MPELPPSKKKASILVSALLPDGTLIETIYRPTTDDTAFVVSGDAGTNMVLEWQSNGVTFKPVSGSNNLIKHQAVLLPSGATDYPSTEALLAEIEEYIRRYVALTDEQVHTASAYILLSWVYDAFNELPYLRFRGDYGTGKTRALIIVGSLCYKVFFASGASTVAPIFHTLDLFKGTLIFDEADFRFTDEKAELVKILNNGNAKGFPVLRIQVGPQKEFDPRAFIVFGPKIIGMRGSYEDRALESRFITIEMEPGRSSGVPINLPDEQRDEALLLRNKLLTYRCRNRHFTAIDPALAERTLEARANQILLPLLSVISDERLRQAIVASARRQQEGVVSDRGATTEGQVLAIVMRLGSAQPDVPLSVASITAAFTADYSSEYERPVTNRWIGMILRRLRIALYKSNGIYVLVPDQTTLLDALCKRYGVDEKNDSKIDGPGT